MTGPIKKAKISNLRLFYCSFHQQKPALIDSKLIIKLTTAIAVLGFSLVILNLLFNFKTRTSTLIFVVGFAMMFLGTLWKAVIDMNKED
jgi:hypothetical protein